MTVCHHSPSPHKVNRGVGELNLTTTALFFVGNLVRCYTTITQIPDDTGSLVSAMVGAGLNGTLVAQILLLGKGDSKKC